jgi:hypothetical protein
MAKLQCTLLLASLPRMLVAGGTYQTTTYRPSIGHDRPAVCTYSWGKKNCTTFVRYNKSFGSLNPASEARCFLFGSWCAFNRMVPPGKVWRERYHLKWTTSCRSANFHRWRIIFYQRSDHVFGSANGLTCYYRRNRHINFGCNRLETVTRAIYNQCGWRLVRSLRALLFFYFVGWSLCIFCVIHGLYNFITPFLWIMQ